MKSTPALCVNRRLIALLARREDSQGIKVIGRPEPYLARAVPDRFGSKGLLQWYL
jgi:hypothetical protein